MGGKVSEVKTLATTPLKTFKPDADGIIPITDTDWFDDDATHRVVEFVGGLGQSPLEANLNFLAYNLSPKKGESSRDTVRRYLSDKFFKDHLETYKKRPIYWCSPAASRRPFSAWSTCTAITRAPWRGCAWSTSCRCRAKWPPASSAGRRIEAAGSSAQAKRLQKERDKLASNSKNCAAATNSSITTATSASRWTSTTA